MKKHKSLLVIEYCHPTESIPYMKDRFRKDPKSEKKLRKIFGDDLIEVVYSMINPHGEYFEHPMSGVRDHIIKFRNGRWVRFVDACISAEELEP